IYALFGPQMPGMLAHRGLSLQQLIQSMFFTTEGILGTPLQASSTYIFLFLLFGAFLVQTGVGNYFNDLAIGIAGKRRSEEHTSELQSRFDLVCRLLLEKKKQSIE